MSRRTIDLSSLPVPDKKRRRASFFAPVQRFWVRSQDGGVLVRWLQVSRYDDEGKCRNFVLVLWNGDRRPLGIELCKSSKGYTAQDRAFYYRNYYFLDKYVWTETVYVTRDEAAATLPVRGVAGLLTERAVNREEAA